MNYLPVRPLIKCNSDDGAWVIAQKADQRKRFKAIICNLKVTEGFNQSNRIKYDHESNANANNFKFSKEFILENCKTVDPDKIAVINVSFKDLESSEDEFYEFSSVYKIDASSNRLTLDDFITFIPLIELNLSSNNVRNININPQDFENLEILDLSFNNLCSEDILMLGLLRKLKILNLTGNNLQALPLDMAHPYMGDDGKAYRKFESLEELHIEYNQLHSSSSFSALGGLPKLRILKLAHNNFESIPMLKCIKLKTNSNNYQINNYEIDYEEEEEMEDYQNSFFTKNMELRIPSTLHEVEEETTYRTTIDTKSSNEYSPKIVSKEAKVIKEILDEIIDKIDLQQHQESKDEELEAETEDANSNYRTEINLNAEERNDEEIQPEFINKSEDFTGTSEKNYFEENNAQVFPSAKKTYILEIKENIEIPINESPSEEDFNDNYQHETFSEKKETINPNLDELNIDIQSNQSNNLKENLTEDPEDKINTENTDPFKQEPNFIVIQVKENEINLSNENEEQSDQKSRSNNNNKIMIDKQNSKIKIPKENNKENDIENSGELIPYQEENEDRNQNKENRIAKDNEDDSNKFETLETFDEMKWMSLSQDEENSYHSLVIVNDFMKSSSVSDIIRQLSISSFNENSPKPFPALEFLDLSFNQIKSERVLIPVIAWLNLKMLSIFNNPISMKKSQKSSFIKVLLENTFKIKVEWLPPISKEKPNPTIKKSKLRVVDMVPNVPLNCRKSNAFHTGLIKTEENELNLPKMMPLPNILKQSHPTVHENNSLAIISEMNKPDDDLENDLKEGQSFKLLGRNKTFLMRALQYKIDHPITYFERNVDLFEKQNSLQSIKKRTYQIDERKMGKSENIVLVLKQQKNRVNQSEMSLDKVLSTEFLTLNRKNTQESAIASKALKNMQKKYNQVRLESLNKEY